MKTSSVEFPVAATFEEQIKLKATDLGFSLCGITTADPPSHHKQYQQWLEAGMHGEMNYLERQESKRGSLDSVLPGVRSVIVVALNYHTGESMHDADGVIAKYARFDDYHQTLWSRLDALSDFVKQERPSVRIKPYCDTGPVTERDLAMRAGIGWIGKHTNLIDRRLGNWFFLGELLLDLDLTADLQGTTHCGTCTRCIPACPTGAIVEPYKLDARRCISYLTIELKGSIPLELRPLIGNRIYGCDDCLAVCPWNKFAVRSKDPAVQPRNDLISADLCELIALDDRSFKSKFSQSPILRTKRRGFVRNVCIALGNVGDSSALPHLAKALTDHEPLIQEHASWAIDQIDQRRESN